MYDMHSHHADVRVRRASTAPFVPVLQSIAAANCTTPLACAAKFYSATGYLPILTALLNAGAAWPTKHGILYP